MSEEVTEAAAAAQSEDKDHLDRLHTFETDLYCNLTSDEVRERGEALATTLEQIRQEKEELKDFSKAKKQTITLLEQGCKRLGDATRFHRELRLTPVDVVMAGNGMVNEIRVDTGEVIRTRRLTEMEAQMTVPVIGPGAEKKGKTKKK
jgi:hypothetical protein